MKRKSAFVGLVAAALSAFAVGASAATLTIDLDFEFSGGADPAGTPPWLRATFSDVAGGGVELTLTSLLQGPTEFIADWDFNLDPALDPTALDFAFQSGGTFTQPTITTGVNAFQADGDGKFDIEFLFSSAGDDGDSGRFGVGDFGVWLITGIDGLDVFDFDFNSVEGGGNGTYTSAAHVQGIATAPGSGWIGNEDTVEPPFEIPEPTTLALLGLGLMGLAAARRKSA